MAVHRLQPEDFAYDGASVVGPDRNLRSPGAFMLQLGDSVSGGQPEGFHMRLRQTLQAGGQSPRSGRLCRERAPACRVKPT